MTVQLTENFIEALYKNQFDRFENPIVQVLNIRSTQSNTNRVIISDGKYFMQTLMSSQLMDKTSNVRKNCLIKIKKCISNRLQKNGVVSIFGILLDFDVLPYENLNKIGNPKNIQEVYPPQTILGYDNTNDKQAQENNNNKPNNFSNNNINNNNNNNNNNNGKNDLKNNNIFPIKSLSPYINRWTICAKAINKSDVRTWNNARGSGKLFSVIFMDDSCEIKATAFNDACDKLFDLIQEDQIYYISNANIKIANKQYNNVKNEYEMGLDVNTNIVLCNDNKNLQMHYSFIPINQLENIEKDSLVDVIGVVDQLGEVVEITSKTTNRPINKRDIYLVDDSGFKIKVTLWGKHTEDTRYEDKPIVAFKSVRVNDFQGKSISTLSSSIISFNPDIKRSHEISTWYYNNNNNGNYQTLSNLGTFNGGDSIKTNVYKTLDQIKEENASSDKADYFNTIATIAIIKKENFAYPACPGENCNKKVIEEGDGWRCEKCNRTYQEPQYRYILSLNVLDHTGNQWLTCFNEVAEKLIGHNAQELQEIKKNDENEFTRILDDINFRKYDFRVRAKVDTYQDDTRLRCNIIDFKPINYENQIKNNITAIDELMHELHI